METIEEVARRLAAEHGHIEPGVEQIYWFRDSKEIRFIEIDDSTAVSEEIEPFYFAPDVEGGIPYPSGVAVIRSQEKEKLHPPKEWGPWEDAKVIWRRNS